MVNATDSPPPPPIASTTTPPVSHSFFIPPPRQTDELANPYFLHHGDSPGAVLVSQPLVEGNYPAWCRAMTMALNAKKKYGFVDGTAPQPAVSDPAFGSWMRSNNMILSWLLNSVSKELATSILYFDTARDLWIDLKGAVFSR